MAAAALLAMPVSVRQTLEQATYRFTKLDHRSASSSRPQQWRDGVSNYMVPFNTSSDADDLRPEVGQRIAHFLRLRYLDARAKRCSQEFGVKEETAQGWLEGRMPQNKHFVQMLRAFGAPFAAFVLEPCGEWARAWSTPAGQVEAETKAESEVIRSQLAEIQKRLERAGL